MQTKDLILKKTQVKSYMHSKLLKGHATTSSTQVHSAKIGHVLVYSLRLFGQKLFSMQDKLVNNKETHFLKQKFSDTITPIDKSCMLLLNL